MEKARLGRLDLILAIRKDLLADCDVLHVLSIDAARVGIFKTRSGILVLLKQGLNR
jgi:hypothetical protein